MNKEDFDRILREMGVSGGITGFQADAAKWSKEAKQCISCQAWALLDENDKCAGCRQK